MTFNVTEYARHVLLTEPPASESEESLLVFFRPGLRERPAALRLAVLVRRLQGVLMLSPDVKGLIVDGIAGPHTMHAYRTVQPAVGPELAAHLTEVAQRWTS